jgi:RNA 2',3'-cyclic 3'-phosphodiesterase
MRTFIAIPLPPEGRKLLAALQETLRAFRADVKWTAPASIHLTLKFLGEIDPAALPRLVDLIDRQTAGIGPFTLRMHGLGGFPNLRNPRVIWCGLEGDLEQLGALQRNVEAACCQAGFAPEERLFQPHLTLGRVRGKTNLQPLVDYIKIGSTLEHIFTADQIHVYESVLRPQGALYTVLKTLELKGGQDGWKSST